MSKKNLGSNRAIAYTLGFVGLLGILGAAIITPSFATKYLSADHQLSSASIHELQILRFVSLMIGGLLITSSIALAKTNLSALLTLAESFVRNERLVIGGVTLSERVLIVGVASVLILANLLPIWLVRFPPLRDYPNHLLSAHIVAHYGDPSFDYAQNFAVSWRLQTNMLGHLIIAGLACAVSTPLAGKLFLTLYIILFPISLFYFINAVDSRKLLLGFFGLPLTYSWMFCSGHLNFCIGLTLYFFALGLWWHTRSRHQSRVTQMVVLGGLTLLIYLCHLLPFAVWIVTVAFLWSGLIGWRITIKRGLLLAVLVVIILIPMMLAFDVIIPRLKAVFDHFVPPMAYFALPRAKLATAYRPFISFSRRREGIISLILLSLYLGLVLRNAAQWTATPFLGLALLMIGLYFVLPEGFALPGPEPPLAYAAVRLLLVGFILGLPVLYVPSTFKWRCGVMGLLIVMSVAHTVTMLQACVQGNMYLSEYSTGLQHIPPYQAVLPIQRGGKGYTAHAWAYYHIDHGGLPPYVFCGRYHLLDYRNRPPLPLDPDIQFAETLARHDFYVLLRGKAIESMETSLLTQGFEPLFSLGDNVMYRVARQSRQRNRFAVNLVVRNYPYVAIYGREDPDVDPLLLEHYKVIFSQGQMRILERIATTTRGGS